MVESGQFRVLVATDGSPAARAALQAAVKFPWPEASRARGVVALEAISGTGFAAYRAALERSLLAQAEPARRALAARWSDAEVVARDAPPAEAILGEARRFRADAIALGWRGHGALHRLIAGSVSRKVVAQAGCPVLVARAAPTAVRCFVVGFDAVPSARRAVRLLSRLRRPQAGLVLLVNVVEPLGTPTVALLPASVRATIRREAARLMEQRLRRSRRGLEEAAAPLRRLGWRVRTEVRVGVPLECLLAAAEERRADVLVLGARATSGVARALLGSVAAGALNHSRIPVLIVP